VAAALPISGLTAWQGLFDHADLTTGQTVLIHGTAGGVGSIAAQLAREVGRPRDRHRPEMASAFDRRRRTPGRTIIQVADEQGAHHS
jgi:hypothetical protein